MFEILFKEYDTVCKRHVDQLIKYTGQTMRDMVISDENSVTSDDEPDLEPHCGALSPPATPPPAPTPAPSAEAPQRQADDNEEVPTGQVEEEEEQWSEAIEPNVEAPSAQTDQSYSRSCRERTKVDYKKFFCLECKKLVTYKIS